MTEPIKIAAMVDESLCHIFPITVRTCEREGASPHRHFTAIQVEWDPDKREVSKVAVQPNFHAKEVDAILAELRKAGVIVYEPSGIPSRYKEKEPATVTVAREQVSGEGARYYVDKRDSGGNVIDEIAAFADSVDGYNEAVKLATERATYYNVPLKDMVKEELLKKFKQGVV